MLNGRSRLRFCDPLLIGKRQLLGSALAKSSFMAVQLSQDVTTPPNAVKVKRFLAECGHLPLAKWAAYAYTAQAAVGFAIGLALPWVRLFTQ